MKLYLMIFLISIFQLCLNANAAGTLKEGKYSGYFPYWIFLKKKCGIEIEKSLKNKDHITFRFFAEGKENQWIDGVKSEPIKETNFNNKISFLAEVPLANATAMINSGLIFTPVMYSIEFKFDEETSRLSSFNVISKNQSSEPNDIKIFGDFSCLDLFKLNN